MLSSLSRRSRGPPALKVPLDYDDVTLSERSEGSPTSTVGSIPSSQRSEDEISPSTLAGWMSDPTKPGSSLVVATLNALKVERARSRALQAQLELRQRPSSAENANNEEEEAEEEVDEEAPPLQRAQSASRLRALRILTSSNAANVSITSKLAKQRKVPKRSRVVIEPLRVGTLVESAQAAALAACSTASDDCGAPAQAQAKWPEPFVSPPRKSTAAESARKWAADGSSRPALSTALGAHVRATLSEELERLQESLQSLLSSDQQPASAEYARAVRSLARRLGWLRSDLAVLSPLMPTERPALDPPSNSLGAAAAEEAEADAAVLSPRLELASLLELATHTEDFVLSLRAELAAQERAKAETTHAEELCRASGLRRASVPHDGDCLFACAHEWLQARAQHRKRGLASRPAEEELIAVEGREGDKEDAERAVEEIASLCSSPHDVRAFVVDLMREKCVSGVGVWPQAEGQPRVCVADQQLARQMISAVREAIKGQATDGTSVALRAALRKRKAAQKGSGRGGGDDDTAGPSVEANTQTAAVSQHSTPCAPSATASATAAAIESYLEVMGQSGIYGERMEIEMLASLLGAPVHIYYFEGETDAAVESAKVTMEPTERVVPPGVDEAAEPLRLLHLVNERHFELLLPLEASAASTA